MPHRLPRHRPGALPALLCSLLVALSGAFSALGAQAASPTPAPAAHPAAVQDPPPSGDNGTTIDPLHDNCGNDAPTCGQVGESYGFYNATFVNLLYTENYYCDTNVTSSATTGCEAGTGPSATPSANAIDGTTLGNTSHGPTLYIPVPLFSGAPPTQCTATATCIDHPPTIDLSRIAAALPGNPSPSSVANVPIPAHNHVVATRAGGLPVWWNVQVVATSMPATFSGLTSKAAIDSAVGAGHAVMVPTNVFLFFQVLPGTVPAAQAANLAASAPPGAALPAAPDPDPATSQVEPGASIDNLNNDCGATAPNCENIGTSHDWIDGQDVVALYSEQFFCDTTVTSGATTGCEGGAPPKAVPPGVADPTAPSVTQTNGNIDPLYVPTPIYASPAVAYTQCPAVIVCIDHPATIDLSRLSSALGAPPAALANVPLPSHDHLLTTRNGDQPEWWNVIVIPVSSPAGLAAVEHAKDYQAVKAMEGVAGSGIVGEVPTNAYLWFQTLPGAGPATPGPVQTTCMGHLPAGSVVAGAALDDGTGYIETDASGDVAVFGAATCYGSLTGQHLNRSIVGIAVDRATGGYWLVATDGGVFGFNAPFKGSTGSIALNKPIVSMVAARDDSGYWLVASDGGVFAFNVPFLGSTGSIKLNKPVVGMALDRATGGYWLVATDGGVFAFGVPFFGSTGSMVLNKPVISIAPVSDGSGYRLIATDGGVFSFDAPFFGSTGSMQLNKPVIIGLNNNSYDGYWLVATDGGVFTFGPPGENMPFFGSAA